MNTNKVSVGPITMALGLIGSGILLLVGNFVDPPVLVNLWKFWPLLLIGLGLEFLIKDIARKRSTDPKEITLSWASLIIVGLVIFAGFTANIAYKIAGSANVDYLIKEALFGNAVQTTRNFQLPPVQMAASQSLILENRRGDIRLEASPDGQVHIKGEIIAGGPSQRDAKARAQQVRTEVNQDANVLIKTIIPEYFGPQDNLRVNYRIAVPKSAKVEINNGVGEIIANNLAGSVQITNQVGAVRAADLAGDLAIQNDTGKITVTDIQGNLKLNTKTGAVEITNPQGDVEATTRVGEIKLASTQALGKSYHLSTQTGSIEIRIPENSNLKIEGVTDRGSVNGPNEYIHRDNREQKLAGELGGGQGLLKVQSQIGSISLEIE